LLQQTGKPYIIENVMWSPLIKEQTILLCGVYFHESHNLRVIRHRLFESDVPLVAPPHMSRWEHPLCVTWNKRHNHYGKLDQWKDYVTVVGGGTCRFDAAKDAMQIPWARKKRELNEAIPPAYTEYVGKQLLQVAA
jgi:DNA (cytosine-5)-methyltransferase 1